MKNPNDARLVFSRNPIPTSKNNKVSSTFPHVKIDRIHNSDFVDTSHLARFVYLSYISYQTAFAAVVGYSKIIVYVLFKLSVFFGRYWDTGWLKLSRITIPDTIA